MNASETVGRNSFLRVVQHLTVPDADRPRLRRKKERKQRSSSDQTEVELKQRIAFFMLQWK